MRQPPSAFRRFVPVGLFLASSSAALAQTIYVGNANPNYGGNLEPSGVETVFQSVGANTDGVVTTAVFGWSNSPCPAAVKIKFFRPLPIVGVNARGAAFLTERGPFDVTQPVISSGSGPPVTQTVVLNPPVQLQARDYLAITNLTSCGGPTFAREVPNLLPIPPRFSIVVPGDVVSGLLLPGPPYAEPVFAAAFGGGATLELLGRFRVGLVAVDPRTGRQSTGSPIPLSSSAGYFGLPDFTGDPTFPEVMVKMVDATGTPSLGGTFWFFHAPLTDVQYTITVTDLTTAKVKTYTGASANPRQLCGGVDTSAFPGP